MVQGFALGGEVGPVTAFLVEAAPVGQRAIYTSWQLASQGIAGFIAGALGMALSSSLSTGDLESWGWRVPFLVCLALIPLAFYLRRSMPETLNRGAGKALSDRERVGARTSFIVVALGGTVSTYVGTYMTTYAITTLKLSATLALSATVVGGLATAVFALLGGWLSDRFGRRPVMLVPRIALVVVAWPAFWLVTTRPGTGALYVAVLALTGLTGISAADPRIAATLDPRNRPIDCLCARGIDFRRHDPVRHYLPDRRDRRSDLSRVVRDLDEHRRGCRHVGHSRDPKSRAGGITI
jgi:MFS family permease